MLPVRSAAPETNPGNVGTHAREHLADGLAGGDLLALLERREGLLPALDAGAVPRRIPRRALLRVERVERLRPPGAVLGAPLGGGGAVGLDDLGWGPERLVGDPHHRLRARHLLGRERVAVGLVVVGVVGRGMADVGAQHEQARTVLVGPGGERARPRGRRSRRRSRRGTRRSSRRRRSAHPRRRCTTSVVGPSIVTWLSSNTQISRPSPRCPASDAASWLTPSIRQPSPAMT